MPQWVEQGFNEYAKRIRGQCHLRLLSVAPLKRPRNADMTRLLRDEGNKLLAAVPDGCRLVALDRTGRQYTSEELALRLDYWFAHGQDVALLVGGPEGLSLECLERAEELWSLSALTFAHPVARVVLAEQLYRAWSIVNRAPYHRSGLRGQSR